MERHRPTGYETVAWHRQSAVQESMGSANRLAIRKRFIVDLPQVGLDRELA